MLFAAPHGGVACDALNRLKVLAATDPLAQTVVADYARGGAIGHMRTHATAILAAVIPTPSPANAALFRRLLGDPLTRYWAVRGLIRTAGRRAYPELVALADNPEVALNVRAHAVKCLALDSGQLFDRELPTDPGHWKALDLRLDELSAWQRAGFPRGPGYPPPARHPALDNPATPFERVVARLDTKLAQQRLRYCEDPANPRGYLVPASEQERLAVTLRWPLPPVDVDFLTRFSPLRVDIEGGDFYDPMWLYGARDLPFGQIGYAFAVNGDPLTGWPNDYVVVAVHGGDPYVLNLAETTAGGDARVLGAEHGTGQWDFRPVAPSFEAFLEQLFTGTAPLPGSTDLP
jgi:hypothetical protein